MTENEWRAALKKHHICRGCKKQDAYTLGGRTYCFECAEKMAADKRARRSTPEGKAKSNEQHRQWRERMASEGLCIYCGQRKASEGHRMCDGCAANMRIRAKNKRQEAGVNWPRGGNGICYQCNKRPVKDGSRLCEQCYGMKVAILHDVNANRDNSNHVRRRMNNA